MIQLSSLKDGDSAQIVTINGGRNINLRMNELGLSIGEIIKVIRNIGGGPIMVELKAGKIAIGRGVARKIFCRRLIKE